MGKLKMTAKVVSQETLATDVYSLVLEAPEIAAQAIAGQFVSVYTHDGSKMLPRPISLCGIDREAGNTPPCIQSGWIWNKGIFTACGWRHGRYIGASRKRLHEVGQEGDPDRRRYRNPTYVTACKKELDCEKSVVLGYRDEIFLNEEFEPYAQVYMSSEDGQHGVKGNVIDAIKEYGVDGAVIYACGPTPMLRGIKAYAMEKGIECQISMEEKMACGVGACLACVCKTKDIDEHSQVHNRRICKDGPVFYAEEVEL